MGFLYPLASLHSSQRGPSSHHGSNSSHHSHSSDRRHHHSRHSSSSVVGHGPSRDDGYRSGDRGSGYSEGGSIFGLGSSANRSMPSSIFSTGSSSRRAKPRAGFVHRMVRKIKRLFKDIMYYMKKNPVKVFFLVIMPLITGGVLHNLLSRVGIRIPGLAALSKGAGAPGIGGGGGYGGSGLSGEGIAGGVGGLMSLAKMFA